jgi:hypothetical protein
MSTRQKKYIAQMTTIVGQKDAQVSQLNNALRQKDVQISTLEFRMQQLSQA